MTFNEALELKFKYENNFVNSEGLELVFTVAPRREQEYIKWLIDLPKGLLDEDAKKYCINNDYWVHYKINR